MVLTFYFTIKEAEAETVMNLSKVTELVNIMLGHSDPKVYVTLQYATLTPACVEAALRYG